MGAVVSVALASTLLAAGTQATGQAVAAADPVPLVVDDFDDLAPGELPTGTDPSGVGVGYLPFSDTGSAVTATVETTPPVPPLPGAAAGNQALALTARVASFAGVVHLFADDSYGAWVPQDWSAFEGFAFWLHGEGTGTPLFVDLLENRAPGSVTDDAERWSVALTDDVAGWRRVELPFDAFTRKDVGNGAPNDGFVRQQVHGWAVGALTTGGQTRTWYVDGLSVYGDAGSLPLTVGFTSGVVDVDEGTTGEVGVSLNRALVETDPEQVTVAYSTEEVGAVAGRDYTPVSGTLTFVRGGPREQRFAVQTFEDPKRTGDRRVGLRLTDPRGAGFGAIRQASVMVVDTDPFDPLLVDDVEVEPWLWDATPGVDLSRLELTADDPRAVPGQGAREGVLEATTPLRVDATGPSRPCRGRGDAADRAVVPVRLLGSDVLDVEDVDLASLRVGRAREVHVDPRTGQPRRHLTDVDRDGRADLVVHVRWADTGLGCDDPVLVTGTTVDGRALTSADDPVGFGRDFAIGQDWSRAEALRFRWYGTGSGDEVTVRVADDRAPDPGPQGWELVWADEFDDPAGTPPDEASWGFELGDVTPDGKDGWGNEERQYYTDDPENAATDGEGNLVLTLREADGSRECYYGTCEYTSARLVSRDRQEFAYGRMETRLKVPSGGGLWPAFWSLGTDIDRTPWPGSGEIDVMEHVGRLPDEVYGTIHGPGYSGGASFGRSLDLGGPVAEEYHTFAVEWEPERITWFVDGTEYHSATPEDVAPNPWVFDKPHFLLLNLAIGGNFGGAIDPAIELPASLSVDYVRVYQGPDTAERFETTFVDDTVGWKDVTVPFADLRRSSSQPPGAPDDGLGLTGVRGYGFELAGGSATGTVLVDQVRLVPAPAPESVVVGTLADAGRGSLRDALETVAPGGVVTFDPGLAGGTVELTRPLAVADDVVVDASAAPGLTLSGQDRTRVLEVAAGAQVSVSHLRMTDGHGVERAGAVLNHGSLVLDHVRLTGNRVSTQAGDFWQGGGAVYNGEGASLRLVDSTVSGNTSGWAGGGVYAFLGSTTVVERSTLSGNTAADVGGGLRSLGTTSVVNSTVSGNTATAWHGGGIFHTDGALTVSSSTVVGNVAPAGTASGLVVASFGAPADLTLSSSIVEGVGGAVACAVEGGAATLTSTGSNVVGDASCAPVDGDLTGTSAGVGPLADHGGPTPTHALPPGSPAVDAGDPARCPPVDQRGRPRADGACDTGSYERGV
ncbi:hypothetical protein GCM10027194_27830 [Thalassiella azotivora]